jgi:uncharacterized protein (TIGR00255 family)
MTGFGRADTELAGVSLAVEVRTVNHRHLDVSVRLPRLLSALENDVRSVVAARFGRGKADVSVSLGHDGRARQDLELDAALAARYHTFVQELSADLGGLDATLPAAALLGLPGVARLVDRDVADDEVRPGLLAAAGAAADEAAAMRVREGEALDRDLRQRLAEVERLAEIVSSRAGEVAEAIRQRLRRRAEQLRDEVVRLRSHVGQSVAVLDADEGEPVGRRLDFLLQEMGREANTIGSKANDAPLAHVVVDLKTELERIREQVQNVE